MPDLFEVLHNRTGEAFTDFLVGYVSNASAPFNIVIEGATITNPQRLNSYTPVLNHNVLVLRWGTGYFVLGALV